MNDEWLLSVRSQWQRAPLDAGPVLERFQARSRWQRLARFGSAAGLIAITAGAVALGWLAVVDHNGFIAVAAIAFMVALPPVAIALLDTWRPVFPQPQDASVLEQLRQVQAWNLGRKRRLAGATTCAVILFAATGALWAVALASRDWAAAAWPSLFWLGTALGVLRWRSLRKATIVHELAAVARLLVDFSGAEHDPEHSGAP
jgi:hypothetical protein